MESDQRPVEKVPLFKKWSYWYWLVAGFLLLCILFSDQTFFMSRWHFGI